MIQTKRQYDHVVGALNAQNIERPVPIAPHGPIVEAFVSGHQLFVASHDVNGKRWTPVVREALADGLNAPSLRPNHGIETSLQGPPPVPPSTIVPSQMHLSPFGHGAPIFHQPQLWDVDYTDFILDTLHDFDAPAAHTETPTHAPPAANYPPLAMWPLPDASAGGTQAVLAPHLPPSGAANVGVFAPVDVFAAFTTGLGTQAPTSVPAAKSTAIRSQFVDPLTGQAVAPGTAGAISYARFKRREYEQRRVDPATGRPPTSAGVQTVTYASYKKNRLVDAQTGEPATAKTQHRITANAFYQRQWLAKIKRRAGAALNVDAQNSKGAERSTTTSSKPLQLVDPHTGQVVAPGTAGAISLRTYRNRVYNRQLVDPRTGQPPTSPGVPTVTRNNFNARALVDPQTGNPARADTQDPIRADVYRKRRREAAEEK